MIKVNLHGSRTVSAAALAEAVERTKVLSDKYREAPKVDAPELTDALEAQILALLAKPRTTLNTMRMNKLLKQAGLDSSFGKHKGKL